MNKTIRILTLAYLLVVSCQPSADSVNNKSDGIKNRFKKPVADLIEFFNGNAYVLDLGTYYSDLDNSGNVISGRVYNVALSRLIYGLSYSSELDKLNLKRAEKSAKFQIANLTSEDSLGGYFLSFYDIKKQSADSSENLDIWQQAYGLCGLSELYRNKPNPELLKTIHKFHDSFMKRFHDDVNGGFFEKYSMRSGKVSGSKTLQSLMYPITSYMENLWIADTINRAKYESYLKENLAIAYHNVWNKDLGWVNIKFDDFWKPCKHKSADELCFTDTPGHNFQFATLLLRTKKWTFLNAEERLKYNKLGSDILEVTLNKPIFSNRNLSQGFCSEINPVDNSVIDSRKTWWQHCEALIALSLADKEYSKVISELEKFFFENFQDTVNGGEYFFLDKDNNPQTEELKGSIGKSAYHTIEMVKFLSNK